MKEKLMLSSIIVLAIFLVCSCGNKASQPKVSEKPDISTSSAIQENLIRDSSIEPSTNSSVNTSNQAIQSDSDSISSFESIQKTTYNIDNESAESTLLQNIGKTYNSLKKEHPTGVIQNNPLPDAGAVCIGEPDINYAFIILGTQDFPFEDYAEEYKDQFKCSGLYTTVGVYFPIANDMTLADFFSSIGISSYDNTNYFGWLSFQYKGMVVDIDTGEEYGEDGIFSPDTIIRRSYPVSIMDNEMDMQNQKVIDGIDY